MPKKAAKKTTPKPKRPATKRSKSTEVEDLLRLAAATPGFSERAQLFQDGAAWVMDHVTPRGQAFVAAAMGRHLLHSTPEARLWLACADARVQDQLCAELEVWQTDSVSFPKLVHSADDASLPDPDILAERLTALSHLRSKGVTCIVLHAESLDERVPTAAALQQQQRSVLEGQKLSIDALINDLSTAGYERVPQVTERGQFAKRGGILDFFSWQGEDALRLEFFDDELESIRVFDIHDQGSIRRLEGAAFALEFPDDAESSTLVRDHLLPTDLLVWVEPDLSHFTLTPHCGLITSGSLESDQVEDFSTAVHENPLGTYDASDFVLHEARRKAFHAQLEEWRLSGWHTVVFLHNEAERERFTELMGQSTTRLIETKLGLLYRGFVIPSAKLAILTGAELFGRHHTHRRLKGSKLDETQTLRMARDLIRDLKEGDLVVHTSHGIGKFSGIALRGEATQKEEVMVIAYADHAKVFVPTSEAHLVTRYVGVGGKAPTLNRIGDARWQTTRKKAERAVEDFAAKMLTMAAERQSLQASPHQPDGKWQREFEDSFVYRETPDQLKSVTEIKADMEATRPMDRLLCADVGFGKTEVAIRAAFKCVMGGRQAAILVPTTVLAVQHCQTFRQRMSEFPVRVEMLCRLTPPDKEREILRGLADGSVDIVVGTQRLISKDVHYKHLGLAVVDEEQRFGVRHKERFKELFRLVDVLTLSATPIPRTLYLALMGMRDMSTIETPPPNKQAVQTIICQFDERVIRDAINAELDRGGQIFFLHNKVKDIQTVASKLHLLCPRARVAVGHGQMEAGQLEDVMHTFVEGEADVLVCTTIIESGVDIPNANTIIIDRADRFGLADLYQLRGRVGRAGQRASAYLMLPRDMVTGGDARKRVNAMKQYTALGSGFKIAMRDLEIRGAGNLLGTEQSGHIAAVGFDMYCQMLKQAVNRSQGRRTTRPVDVALRIDFLCLSESAFLTSPKGTQPAFVPTALLDDPMLRIQVYRSLAEVTTKRELDDLEHTWRDQFGRLDLPLQNLLFTAALRLAASSVGVSDIEIKDRKLMLKRNNAYLLVHGKFPRLHTEKTSQQLEEALKLIKTMPSK